MSDDRRGRPPTPNPGSPQAQAAGCRCPAIDNRYGGGIGWDERDGERVPLFVMSADCPLHGSFDWKADE